MTRRTVALLLGLMALPPAVPPAAAASATALEVAVTLRGSRESMTRQNRIAKDLDLSFLATRADVVRAAMHGELVHVGGNADFMVIAAHPYTLPETAMFVERLGSEYRAACAEQLVVTSLTRPSRRQPANASPLSVHPAGMAVDLRVSAQPDCVSWLSSRLLELESKGIIDATREYRPPHFHVAVFPAEYARYETSIAADSIAAAAQLERMLAVQAASIAAAETATAGADAAEETVQRPSIVVRVLRGVARLLGLRQA